MTGPARPLGVDLSSHNHDQPIDYAAVKAAGVEFAIIKITEYPGYVNPFAGADITGLVEVGIHVAGYLFLHPASDPVAAAEFYLEHCGDLAGVGIDLEVTDGGLTQAQIDSAYLRCATVLRDAGKKVALYTDRSMWPWLPHLDYQWLGAPLSRVVPSINPTITADYTLTEVFSGPAGSIHCWQYGQAQVPGIAGLTDVNLWLDPPSYQTFFNITTRPEDPDMPLTPADIQAVMLAMREEFTPGSELYGRVVEAAQKALRQTPLTVTVSVPPTATEPSPTPTTSAASEGVTVS